MSVDFSFEVEHTNPVVVVRPRGVLDAYTAADLRGALLECVAEQPVGVLVDASELSVIDDIGLTVLATVAQQSAHWPGTRFALAAPTMEVAAGLARMGVDRHIALCPDVDSAFLELARWPAPPWTRRRITPDRDAPAMARAAVHAFLEEHGVRDGDAAQLVASELVTNAVVHAGTDMDLTLRLVPPLLHIAVRDTANGQVKIASIINESSESGRGLLLVDALATAWGTLVPDIGKVVWATVRVRPVTGDR